jgi:hypothetical protein
MAPPATGGYSAPLETVTVGPGQSKTVNVTMPTVNLQVTNGATPIGNANVYVTPVAACTDPGPTRYTPLPKQSLKTSNTAPNVGKLSVPLPYGDYTICADNGTRERTLTVQNRTKAGTALQAFDVAAAGSAARVCP